MHYPKEMMCIPPLYRIKSPSSRFHIIFGRGDPRASQDRFTGLPSLTTISAEVRASIIEGGTAKKKEWINKSTESLQYKQFCCHKSFSFVHCEMQLFSIWKLIIAFFVVRMNYEKNCNQNKSLVLGPIHLFHWNQISSFISRWLKEYFLEGSVPLKFW